MGLFSARAPIATNVQTCCQFNHERHNLPPHGDSVCTAMLTRRAGFICRSTDGKELESAEGIENSTVKEQERPVSSPFAGGKISSRIAAKTAQKKEVASPVSTIQSASPNSTQSASSKPFSVQDAATNSGQVASPFSSKPFPNTQSPFATSSKSTSKVPPAQKPSLSSSKAFPVPSVSSPFDSNSSPVRKPSQSNPNRLKSSATSASPANIDQRILASRRDLLDSLWKEKQESMRAPADIFDEPKPSESPEQDKIQINLGTNTAFLVVSFALIVCLMLATTFVAWKLGAIHYDEV